jgi:hypothetical protein|nr:MAG TPA: Protein of unknown function (DUF1642) [Caudoviricetes sp.]
MNKQELIERIEDFPCEASLVTEMIRINKNTLLGWVKQLDEPQKVVVPQIVADYIKYTKEADWDLQETMDDVAYEDDKDLRKWFNNNIETFVRAWLDGYTVEKEPKYTVKIKSVNQYLVRNTDEDFLGFLQSRLKSKFTRKELEEAGFGEVFNSPLFEVKEVEE